MKTRRSCRACLPDPVEEEKLSAILEAGTYAATGMDLDPFYGAPELEWCWQTRTCPPTSMTAAL